MSDPHPIGILLVDDHFLLRQGLKSVLSSHFGPAVFGEAADANEALALASSQTWNLILLDLQLPGRGGLDLLRELKRHFPKIPVLVLSIHPEEQFAVRVLKLGASGYLEKGGPGEDLLRAADCALRGSKFISESIAQRLAARLEHEHSGPPHELLSDREYQVMLLIGLGATVKEIAAQLSLSVKTISTYRCRILEKMRMANNSQIMRYAVQHGLVATEI